MYYFHLVADGDGWLYKHGTEILGQFDDLVGALDAAFADAEQNQPSELLYHPSDGGVMVIGRWPGPAAV